MSLATDDVFTGSILFPIFVAKFVRGGKLACERIFIYSMLTRNAYICYQFQNAVQIF